MFYSTDNDLKELGCSAAPKDESDLLTWAGVIKGPAPYYSGGTFKIEINFSKEYPFKVRAAGCSFGEFRLSVGGMMISGPASEWIGSSRLLQC